MSYYRTLSKIDRSNGEGPPSSAIRPGDQLDEKMGRQPATVAAPKPAINHKQFLWPYNHTPTFSGAKYWVDRHQRDFKTFAHLLELYPNLLKSEGLNPLREYMVSPENLPSNFTSNPSEFCNHSNSELPSQGASTTTSKRFVYICDNISETDFGVLSTKDKLVAALSSYCCVRTSPEQLGSFIECVDIVDVITAADAFVFLMNSRTLNSWFSLHQLGLAIAYGIPVIAVREAGFKLPPVFPPEFHHLEIVKPGGPLPVPPPPRASPHPVRSKSSDTRRRQGTAAKDVNYHNDFFSDSELLKRSKRNESQPPLLANVISDLYRTSLLYVWHLHDSCIAKLFGRLSDFLGDSFLDLEISQSHNTTDSSDNKLNVGGRGSKQLIVGATSPFRPLPSQVQQLPLSDLSIEREGVASHITPVSKAPVENISSTTNPAENSLRLPPIPTIIGVSISPSPIRSMSRSSLKSATSSVRTPSRRSFVRSPKTPSSSSMASSSMASSPPKKVGDMMPESFMQISPPSSPFVQTNYIVFPTDSFGPKKPPYMVCFPDDVFNEEENERKTQDEDSDEEVQVPEENDTNFNNVRLDVSEDQVLPSRSPYSSPNPRQNPINDKDTPTSRKSERTITSESQANNSDRGLQKGKVKEPSVAQGGTQARNVDKKAMKVSRVVLKYNSDGKPLT